MHSFFMICQMQKKYVPIAAGKTIAENFYGMDFTDRIILVNGKEAQNAKDSVNNLPYVKGGTNGIATGKTQPYIIGTRLFVSYIMNSGGGYQGYSVISGTDGDTQEYIVVLECGFNKQILRKMFCEDVTLLHGIQKHRKKVFTTLHQIYSLILLLKLRKTEIHLLMLALIKK